ncbi:hypothetical protein TWF694_007890 [Orbilia ellipsospora]|uniref:F-box domain-containing protein n=1 Tax=Orbilia ellipsospora TaxID=2528407 RepID=A0AAV9XJ61_9PEZI
MLDRLLRKLQIHDSNISRQDDNNIHQDAQFLHLPADILNLILEYLSYRDLIALSLSTKTLRYLSPTENRSQDLHKEEAACCNRIHQRFLSPPPPKSRVFTLPSPPLQCPYCTHPLCPPSCPTALFLDSRTGAFYPSQLYPIHLAILKSSKTPPKSLLKNGGIPPGRFGYSTIWCQHHRCPRDLFTNRNTSSGAKRFLDDYSRTSTSKWALVHHSKSLGYWLHPRWRVGHKPPSKPTNSSLRGTTTTPIITDDSENKERKKGGDSSGEDLIPVHEKIDYTTYCLHCFQFV